MKDIEKHRIKIEEIRKENIFKTPEKFFEDLPLAIQNRMYGHVDNKIIWGWTLLLKYATPAVIILIGVFLWINWPIQRSPEKLIAQIDDAAILEYLYLSDLSTEDLLQSIEINQVGLNWGDDTIIDQLQIDENTIEMFEIDGIL